MAARLRQSSIVAILEWLLRATVSQLGRPSRSLVCRLDMHLRRLRHLR